MKALVRTDNSWPKPHNWLFKITFSFILGILTARFVFDASDLNHFLFIFIASFSLYLFFIALRGFLIFFMFFSLGTILYTLEVKKINEYDKNYRGISTIKIERILKQKDHLLHAKGLCIDSVGRYLFKAILYIKKDSITESFLPGDFIVCNSSVNLIENTTFPYAFSAKKYYETKGISHAIFLSSKKVIHHYSNSQINLYRIAYLVNKKMIKAIIRWPLKKEAKEVLIALLTGSKDFLTDETREIYADTGTIHVLAVSGLHTGLIYILFLNFFSLIFGNRFKTIRVIFLVGILWFYALFTGLSPSVIRAATMFTFIELGNNLKRKTGIYHSLCLSALLLLSTSPLLLFDIGFQLSYAAVYGIVSTSKFFNQILSISDNFLLRKISEILSVSIAAQLFTFPFTMYYFSKFPTWFFVANLYAIPLITLTLYLGFPIAIFSFISEDFDFLGIIPAFFITINNFLNSLIIKLPFSILDKQFIDAVQFAFLLLTVVLLLHGLVNKKKWIFISGCTFLFLFKIYSAHQSYKILHSFTEIHLSFIQNKPLLMINLKGKKIWMFSDEFQKLKSKEKTIFSKYLNKWQIEESDVIWSGIPEKEKIEFKNNSNSSLRIQIKNVRLDETPKTINSPLNLEVKIESTDGRKYILNRNGDRVLIL
ncbi:MAG: ComEC/Rec2 family competence protein [Thermaurantimonas sp.]|uniref:ComEC/Rec2 family competence protein n=1 Tax=Thermaurantimonas sp. TaxID=2681568 RepID=UPI00391B86D7